MAKPFYGQVGGGRREEERERRREKRGRGIGTQRDRRFNRQNKPKPTAIKPPL